MATLATIADVLASIETDLPDSVLGRMLDSAEEDVRAYVSATERAALPVVIWTGRYTPALNSDTGKLTVPNSIRVCPITRFEGTVTVDGSPVSFMADTEALAEPLDPDDPNPPANLTATLTPVTVDGDEVAAGAFGVTVEVANGKVLTFDTTATTAAITLTRILALTTSVVPAKYQSATLDLVALAVLRRGISSERVGQYSMVLADYHQQRAAVLQRLLFASGSSLVA